MRNLLPALALLALTAVSPAQNGEVKERRGYTTIGLYLPQGIDSFSQTVGLSYSLGGNLVIRENYRVGLELRGSTNRIAFEGPDTDGVGSFDGREKTLSVGAILANYATRPRGGRGTFFGAGLGFARATIDAGDADISKDEARFVFSLFVGQDLSPTTFAVVRYQGAAEEGYRGLSLEFGYRF